MSPTTPRRARRPGCAPHLLHLGLGDEVRGQHAGRVARVDAGVLDVLHDSPDDAPGAVADGVHVRLEGVLQEAVDQHGMVRRHPGRPGEVAPERVVVVDDLHGPAAQDVAGTDQDRIADPARHRDGFVDRSGRPAWRLLHAQLARERLEAAPILGQVDRVGRRAQDAHPCLLQAARQAERRLTAELHHHAERFLQRHDLEHILQRQRLEIEGVGDVEVGGHRLRIRVHHHRAVAQLSEVQRRAHAAVVELDPLADAVGPAAEDDHGPVAHAPGLVLLVVGGVEVRRGRGELAGAGVHRLVDRADAEAVAQGAQLVLGPPSSCASCLSEKPSRFILRSRARVSSSLPVREAAAKAPPPPGDPPAGR